MKEQDITIEGKEFKHVKNRNHMPISIYKNNTSYLRIGPKDLIQKEIEYHKNLFNLGFPVAKIIQEGEYKNYYYFIESSLGDEHFGQIFKKNISQTNIVSDDDFRKLLELVKGFLKSQIKTADSRKITVEQFRNSIQFPIIITELPYLKEKIEKAMSKAENNIKGLPIVLTHGDFNPFNIFERGIIDWERATYSPLGYDLVTNISQNLFFPQNGDFEYTCTYVYSKEQIENYWQEIDEICSSNKLPKISQYSDDFIFCRSIWSVVRMDRWPKIQKWRYELFEKLIVKYLNNENLTEFLLNYPE